VGVVELQQLKRQNFCPGLAILYKEEKTDKERELDATACICGLIVAVRRAATFNWVTKAICLLRCGRVQVRFALEPVMTSDLRVSLPEHLQESLKPLPDLLPIELRALLVQALEPPAKEIHYEVLVKVSTWAHSEDGKERLKAADLRQ
jgi:hypothetical protein